MNQELISYVKQQLSLNASKNKITDTLLNQGWQQGDIDEAFMMVESPRMMPVDSSSDFDDKDAEGADLGDGGGSGGGRGILVAVAGVAVIAVLIFGGWMLLGGKKDDGGQTVETGGNASSTAQTNPEGGNTTGQTAATDDKIKAETERIKSELKLLETTIKGPANWELREGVVNNRPMVAYFKQESEKDKDGKEIFRERVTVTRDSLKSKNAATAADYVAKSKKELQDEIKDYKFVTDRQVKLADGTDATLLSASFTKENIAMRNMQLFAIKGDDAYVVTGLVVAANWNTEKDMIGEAVMSFKYPQ